MSGVPVTGLFKQYLSCVHLILLRIYIYKYMEATQIMGRLPLFVNEHTLVGSKLYFMAGLTVQTLKLHTHVLKGTLAADCVRVLPSSCSQHKQEFPLHLRRAPGAPSSPGLREGTGSGNQADRLQEAEQLVSTLAV